MTSVDLVSDKEHHAFPTPAELLFFNEECIEVIGAEGISADPIALVGG